MCKCASGNYGKFIAAMDVRRPGLKNIDKPGVWVFPEVVVCLDCGTAKFVIPESELRQLTERETETAAAG